MSAGRVYRKKNVNKRPNKKQVAQNTLPVKWRFNRTYNHDGFPNPGDRAEMLMGVDPHGKDIFDIECRYYQDVLHPVRVLYEDPAVPGNFVCLVEAFSTDPKYGIDSQPIRYFFKPREAEPVEFVKNGPIEFCVNNRSVVGEDTDGGETVWVRGRMIEERGDSFLIKYLNWETQRYTKYRTVSKKKCRKANSEPGEY